MIDDGADDIGAIKAVAAAAEVVLKVVVKMERLAGLEAYRAIEAPAILEFAEAAAHFRELVAEDPGKALADVEIGIAVFELGLGAVVGLGGVGLEVFAVAGIVEGVGPGVVDDGGDAVPSVDAEGGLQGVVIGLAGGLLIQHVIILSLHLPGVM